MQHIQKVKKMTRTMYFGLMVSLTLFTVYIDSIYRTDLGLIVIWVPYFVLMSYFAKQIDKISTQKAKDREEELEKERKLFEE